MKVLFVVTAADHWTLADGTRHPSGFWAEELAVPHKLFRAAGWDITLATPNGKAPTVDQLSLKFPAGLPWQLTAHKNYLASIDSGLRAPVPLASVDPDAFDAVFYPGGHGPMEDLATDEVSGRLLVKALRSGKPLALLCHAPAAMLAATTPDGWLFKGYRLTALTNTEELTNNFAKKAKWLLEDRLRENGAIFQKGVLPFLPYVVTDRNLYTGQNPASAKALAQAVMAAATQHAQK